MIPELDLVEEEDQITHETALDDVLDGENRLNRFKFDPFFEKTEEEWTEIKKEILGDEVITNLQSRQTIEAELEELQENRTLPRRNKLLTSPNRTSPT